jgi:hypothetical protein
MYDHLASLNLHLLLNASAAAYTPAMLVKRNFNYNFECRRGAKRDMLAEVWAFD